MLPQRRFSTIYNFEAGDVLGTWGRLGTLPWRGASPALRVVFTRLCATLGTMGTLFYKTMFLENKNVNTKCRQPQNLQGLEVFRLSNSF